MKTRIPKKSKNIELGVAVEPQQPSPQPQPSEEPLLRDEQPNYNISQGWHCCFGPIANMACGWPQGSCTAIITIIAVVGFIGGMLGVLIYGIIVSNMNIVLATLGIFSSGFSFAFGHYIGKSAATTTTRTPTVVTT